jgi:malate dehydrogenase (oxaloacetate-decarboxylating)
VNRLAPALLEALRTGRGPALVSGRGEALLSESLLNKDSAFTDAERDALGLRGLLPPSVVHLEEQVRLELEHARRKVDPLECYIGLVALQDRNETLFYHLLSERLEEFLPIVYTPTVGQACQEFSHIVRRPRGLWITPDDIDRIPQLLRNHRHDGVRLIVATDNERILGLGDQGAGGMAIPIGKLALYCAAAGIHPAMTLPVSLDVGTDRPKLLDDPLYLGWRHPRLRGDAYDAVVDAFVRAVREVHPGALLQWEDFKQHNALRLLDRYRHQIASFNDDVQGTGAVVLAAILAGLRISGARLADQRIVILGAGGAGIGIGRTLRAALLDAKVDPEAGRRAVVMLDSHGLLHAGRDGLDRAKEAFALGAADLAWYGLDQAAAAGSVGLEAVVRAVRPTVLLGISGVADAFDEATIRDLAAHVERPIILPLSNPTSLTEATPARLLAWTDGRALVASGSPFAPVTLPDGRQQVVGQANNVFIFPGVGLGAIVAHAREITDEMFLVAAKRLSELVSPERLADGVLYPPIGELRAVALEVAVAVAEHAVTAGLGRAIPVDAIRAEVEAAMWTPAYVEYLPG